MTSEKRGAVEMKKNWKWIIAFLFVFLCMGRAKIVCEASYQTVETTMPTKVNGITFSFETDHDSWNHFLYVEKNGKKRVLVKNQNLDSVILTNGSQVLYIVKKSVYQISVNGKNKKKLFTVGNAVDGLELIGYAGGKVYYSTGFDPGKVYSCSLKTGKKKLLKVGAARGEQFGNYIFLHPIEGAGGMPSSLYSLNVKTGKIKLISDQLLYGHYVKKGKYVYYVECEYLRPRGFKLWINRCRIDGTGKKTIVKQFRAQEAGKLTKNSLTYVNTKGKIKKKKF